MNKDPTQEKLLLTSWIQFTVLSVMISVSVYTILSPRNLKFTSISNDQRRIFDWIQENSALKPFEDLQIQKSLYCPDNYELLLYGKTNYSETICVCEDTYKVSPGTCENFQLDALCRTLNYNKTGIFGRFPYNYTICGKRSKTFIQNMKPIEKCQDGYKKCSEYSCVSNNEECPIEGLDVTWKSNAKAYELKLYRGSEAQGQIDFLTELIITPALHPCLDPQEAQLSRLDLNVVRPEDESVICPKYGFDYSTVLYTLKFFNLTEYYHSNALVGLKYQASKLKLLNYDNFTSRAYEGGLNDVEIESGLYEITGSYYTKAETIEKDEYQTAARKRARKILHKQRQHKQIVSANIINLMAQDTEQFFQQIFLKSRTNIKFGESCQGIDFKVMLDNQQQIMENLPHRLNQTLFESLIASGIAFILLIAKSIVGQSGSSKKSTHIMRINAAISIIICVVGLFWLLLRYDIDKMFQKSQKIGQDCILAKSYNKYVQKFFKGYLLSTEYYDATSRAYSIVGGIVFLFIVLFYLFNWLCADKQKINSGYSNPRSGTQSPQVQKSNQYQEQKYQQRVSDATYKTPLKKDDDEIKFYDERIFSSSSKKISKKNQSYF